MSAGATPIVFYNNVAFYFRSVRKCNVAIDGRDVALDYGTINLNPAVNRIDAALHVYSRLTGDGAIDIYQTVTNLGSQDSTTYQLNTGFSFELPVLGVQRVPVSHSGNIPLLKLPSVSIGSLKVKSLRFTGADLQLDLKINNPNAFAFNLDAINYKLDINQSQWVSGNSERTSRIGAKSEGNLAIPISLNFLQIGRSAYQLINGNRPLQYHLKGDLDIGTSIPLLGKVNLPIDRAGEIQIAR